MPYRSLEASAFWRLCREDPDFRSGEIYRPKFEIDPDDLIAAAGSCFAQNISLYLQGSSLKFQQMEHVPRGMDPGVARQFGYGLYSARYGNIYSARQLLQLVQDAHTGRVDAQAVWEKNGRYFDALRPGVEPFGLESIDEVLAHRANHLDRVAAMISTMGVFIFTLGLTEIWEHRETGQVYPVAPGVIAGAFDQALYQFSNQGFGEVLSDLKKAIRLMRLVNPTLRVILSVSPVPLTATASGQHVLSATTYSKSVLRAVAGKLAVTDPAIDYFPSFELVAGLPFGASGFEPNLRSVSTATVDRVMEVFFAAYGASPGVMEPPVNDHMLSKGYLPGEHCEEAMLEAFIRP